MTLARSTLIAVLLASAGLVRIAEAQAIRAAPTRVSIQLMTSHPDRGEAAPRNMWRLTAEPTHWVEGGLVGAVVLGVGGYFIGMTCEGETGTNCGAVRARDAFLGAGLGFIVGALIGGAVPKHEAALARVN